MGYYVQVAKLFKYSASGTKSSTLFIPGQMKWIKYTNTNINLLILFHMD